MQGYLDKYTKQVGEGHISVLPWHYDSITQGTWAWNAGSSQIFYGYWINSSGAQNDQINYKVYLDIGIYTYTCLVRKIHDAGICTVLIDGVSVGTIDLYSSSDTFNFIGTITNISVSSAGIKTLSIKAASKNPSSAGYYLYISAMSLFRTA